MDNISPALLTWPPQYTLKKSPRARHVRLKASARYGLELVVPLRFNQKNIPEILETNKSWIQKQLAHIQEQLKQVGQEELPTEISLPGINQTWKVSYLQSDTKKLRLLNRPLHEIVLFGDVGNKMLCKKILSLWVKKLALKYLPSRLQHLSQYTQLTYNNLVIRGQRSRWGSCSAEQSINLNYKLLFLPAELVDHILIHELCHTVHMNHSGKFWRLVASFDSKWKQHCREVRVAEKFVPVWVD